MTTTAFLSLRQTERTVSFTLTLPRFHPGRKRRRTAALPLREQPHTLSEAAFRIQRPLI